MQTILLAKQIIFGFIMPYFNPIHSEKMHSKFVLISLNICTLHAQIQKVLSEGVQYNSNNGFLLFSLMGEWIQ